MFGITAFAEAPFASLGGANAVVSVALTGNAASGAVGTVTGAITVALTGVSGVGNVLGDVGSTIGDWTQTVGNELGNAWQGINDMGLVSKLSQEFTFGLNGFDQISFNVTL